MKRRILKKYGLERYYYHPDGLPFPTNACFARYLRRCRQHPEARSLRARRRILIDHFRGQASDSMSFRDADEILSAAGFLSRHIRLRRARARWKMEHPLPKDSPWKKVIGGPWKRGGIVVRIP